MSLLQLTNLWPPFTGQPLEESEVVVYVPVVHYHKLKGPSRKRLHLIGPTQRAHKLTGPSKRIKRLSGSE